MGQEIELKFRVPPGDLAALAKRLKVGAPLALTATYFDSADQRLRKAGLSLRLRQEGDRRVQTAKGAGAGLLGREEVEVEATGDAPNLGLPGFEPLVAALDGAPLRALFAVTVERRTALVTHDGATIEAAIDLGEAEAEGRKDAVAELELELKAGDPAALFALARELSNAAPLDLDFGSKAARGYALLDGHETAGPPATPAARGLTAGAAFQAAARACLDQAQVNARALIEGRRPEALHQTRVALRRLRSLLSAFRPVLADDGYEAVKTDLKTLSASLNEARDLDVFTHEVFQPAALAASADERHGLAGLGTALHQRLTAAYDAALAAMDSDHRRRVVLDAAAWIETGAWATSSEPLRREARDRPADAFARETLDALRRKLKRDGARLGKLDAHDRHRVRIRAKKLRYAAHAFAPLFGHAKRRRAFFKALKRLQTALGELNDRSVGRDLALRVTTDADPEAAFAAGRLIAAREADEATLLADAEAAYADLVAVKPFWRG